MDIEDVKKTKEILRKDILDTIRSFEQITKCTVEEINLSRTRDMHTGITSTITVEIEITL